MSSFPSSSEEPSAPSTSEKPAEIAAASTAGDAAEPSGTASRAPASKRPRAKAHDLFVEPLTWGEIVTAERSVELEVGSGKGLFLESAATARPQHYFVGIELAAKFAHRAADRLAVSKLANARMLRGDAEAFLRETVPDASVVAVHVYFPDPWWRRKHKKRRVLNEETLAAIERIIVPGGKFHFWTDVLDYYELICGQVMELTQLMGPRYVPERKATHDLDYTTHFERRARRNGQPIYRSTFDKPTSPQ